MRILALMVFPLLVIVASDLCNAYDFIGAPKKRVETVIVEKIIEKIPDPPKEDIPEPPPIEEESKVTTEELVERTDIDVPTEVPEVIATPEPIKVEEPVKKPEAVKEETVKKKETVYPEPVLEGPIKLPEPSVVIKPNNTVKKVVGKVNYIRRNYPVQKIFSTNYAEESSTKKVIVLYTIPGCPPCDRMKTELADKAKGYTVYEYVCSRDCNSSLFSTRVISSYPSWEIVEDGRVSSYGTGFFQFNTLSPFLR